MNVKTKPELCLESFVEKGNNTNLLNDSTTSSLINTFNANRNVDSPINGDVNFRTVPTLYLEPRMLMVDDDSDFLDAIGALLCDMMSIETSLDPLDVIEQLRNNQTLQRLVQDCILPSEDSSDHTDVIYLNYKNLAQKLYAYYLSNEFISVVCIDYRMPTMNGLDVARELKGMILSRILLTADIEMQPLLSAYEEGIITKLIRKTEDDLECVIEDAVAKQHIHIIQDLNQSLFGSFINHSAYATLFSHLPFISMYQSLLNREKIVFSCVYEAGGSLILLCRDGTSFLLNVYSENELCHSLFPSEAYETSLSSQHKEKIERFECIVDYKTNNHQRWFDDLAHVSQVDSFSAYTVKNNTYYVIFKKIK